MATVHRSKQNPYEKITNRILSLLEAGTVPWHRPWTGCRNLVSGKEYRGVNTFLLGCEPYESPFWITFKQAKTLGGSVRKGEHGCPVVFWKWLPPKTVEREDEDGNTVTLVDGRNPLGRPMLRQYTAFNVEQCDGLEIPTAVERDNEPIAVCESVVENMPQRPDVRHESSGAFYRPSEDFVSLPGLSAFESPEAYYSVLFHELTHSTGHASRLGRHGEDGYTFHGFGSKNYSREELVAEMGAAFLSGHCGVENRTIDNSASYIDGWRRKLGEDPRLVVIAAAQAQKSADFTLGRKFDGEGE